MINLWTYLIFKFLILILLYVFIYKMVKIIILDIRKTIETGNNTNVPDSNQVEVFNKSLYSGANTGLLVVESNLRDIRPGMKYYINKNLSIGRDINNSIPIKDAIVSHKHARIFVRDGRFYVEDMNSKNGTIVNGVQVKDSVSLNEGDLIKVGGVTFKLVRWQYASS